MHCRPAVVARLRSIEERELLRIEEEEEEAGVGAEGGWDGRPGLVGGASVAGCCWSTGHCARGSGCFAALKLSPSFSADAAVSSL